MKLKTLLLLAFAILSANTFATTWNEPWADKVIKEAQYFVLAKVKSFDEDKGVTIEIIKTLGGPELKGKIEITAFYLLHEGSSSEGHGGDFDFGDIKESYFFIKKNDKGKYCIATPSTGFDYVYEGNVHATYRHSYHQALVPVDVYEKTMTAIFNNYHGLPYDSKYINDYVKDILSHKPAGFSESEMKTFFAQHVALECIYHLRLTGYYSYILPFLNDTANFHNEVSAARALIAYNTPETKKELMNVIRDTARSQFLQVICLWTLTEFKPKELKEELTKIKATAPDEDLGFGGNIMDPRIGTYFPSVKEALEKLIALL
ncbi:MAG: hypothetical protein JWO44_2678 [Bacteroidetes bacterium]|nr:hypothetical protein [Bacteroidota bacterium]